MKFSKLILPAALITFTVGCADEPEDPSGNTPGGTETPVNPDEPDRPSEPSVVSPTPAFSLTTKAVSLDSKTTYQEMEGFGASDCWLPAQIGKYWLSDRGTIADWLFSQKITDGQPEGIGLSMWRVNLGAGTYEQGDASRIDSNNRAESYLSGDTYDWSKCEGQRYFMQQARENGVEKFVLFSNSPLVQWTRNGLGFSQSGSKANLKDDCYDDFAEYLVDVAKHFVGEGYNVTHISPVNEPQYNWNGTSQEGSGWQNSEIARLVKEMDAELEESGIGTKILIPEAGAWDHLYSGSTDRKNQIGVFFGSGSDCYVGNLKHLDNVAAGHSYWTFDNWDSMRDVRSKVADAAKGAALRVWQTEWSMLDACPSELGGNYDNISEFDIAFYMSKIIHNDITVAGCSSWSYWTSMSVERWSQKNRFELIKTTPAGGNYSDDFTAPGVAVATDNLWVLGNYSRFVRPGYRRVKLSLDESREFFGTAYVAPDGSRIVLVITNADREKGVSLDLQVSGAKSVYTYTNTESKHLQEARFNPADKVFVDPYSVTTVVYNF